MLTFTCSICGEPAQAEEFALLDAARPATCSGCGSTTLSRSLAYLFTREFFGECIPLAALPPLKTLRGIGLSDSDQYEELLTRRFSYRNTYFRQEPRLDITEEHPSEYGRYDFLIASEVFEHISPPTDRALTEAFCLLKRSGRLFLSVPFTPEGETAEHFPALASFALTEVDGRPLLVNRTAEGCWEVHDDLKFHHGLDGQDEALEMRLFSRHGLMSELKVAGFEDIEFCPQSALEWGIVHPPWSMPLVARKDPLPYPSEHVVELVRALIELRSQGEEANRARWSLLGRKLGVGPRIELWNRAPNGEGAL